MKKILILAYRFPPNNETGAFRPLSWAENMKALGYYPVVISRHWDTKGGNSVSQTIQPSKEKEIKHEKNESYEVLYLPFKGNVRTRTFTPKQGLKRNWYRVLYYLEQLLEYSGIYQVSMYYFMFKFVLNHLKENKYDKVIITAAPYELFQLGYLIKRKFNIDWIADYRDPWTNRTDATYKNYFPYSIIWNLEKKAEKKWVKSAQLVTNTSYWLTDRIKSYIPHSHTATIFNGYFEKDEEFLNSISRIENQKTFTILYNGNLFSDQPIQWFIDAVKSLVSKYKNQIHIQTQFAGITYIPSTFYRMKQLIQGWEENFILMDRMSKNSYLELQKQADCLLLVDYLKENGMVVSKVFDYILSPLPVLVFPNHEGSVTKLLTSTGHGIFANNQNEVQLQLGDLINKKLMKKESNLVFNFEAVNRYSRKEQTRALIKAINSSN